MPDPTDPGPTAPDLDASALPEGQRLLLERAAEDLPTRAQTVLAKPSHRALGRVVRDAVLLLLLGDGPHGQSEQGLLEVADQALDALAELQNPSGTFRGGDNLDSPPDSAFTLNDLGWARTAPGAPESLLPALDRLLLAATPALLTGGVHTPNHRWEIASALSRLWEAHGDQATRSRAEQWLAEGVDLQRTACSPSAAPTTPRTSRSLRCGPWAGSSRVPTCRTRPTVRRVARPPSPTTGAWWRRSPPGARTSSRCSTAGRCIRGSAPMPPAPGIRGRLARRCGPARGPTPMQ